MINHHSTDYHLIPINVVPGIRHLNNPLVWTWSPVKTRLDLAPKLVLLVHDSHMTSKVLFVVGKLSPLLGQQTLLTLSAASVVFQVHNSSIRIDNKKVKVNF